MRIAICGTHGTGKTTLARALSERLGVPMIHEVARHVIKANGFENTREYIDKADLKQKEIIQCDIFQEQVTWERDYENFISDRSVFDAVAYAAAYEVDEKAVNWLLGQAVGHALNIYDLLVYVPIMWKLESDGFRDMDEELRDKVNRKIQRYVSSFSTLGGNVLLITTKDPKARIEKIITEMKRLEEQYEMV